MNRLYCDVQGHARAAMRPLRVLLARVYANTKSVTKPATPEFAAQVV